MSLVGTAPDATTPARPLSRRFAAWVSGLTLSLLLLLGSSDSFFGYQDAVAGIAAVQEQQAHGAAREIGAYLGRIVAGLSEVTRTHWGVPGLGVAQQRQELHRLMQRLPAITELQAVDADGRESLFVSRTEPDRAQSGRPIGEPELTTNTADSAARFGRTFFRDGEWPVVRIAVPEGAGAVVATVDLRMLGDIVTQLQASEQAVAYVVDANGTLIAHPRMTHVLGRRDLSQAPAVLAARSADAGSSTVLRSFSTTDLAGQPVLVTGARIPDTRWLVFMERPRALALKPAFATLTRTLVLMGIGAVLAVLAGIAFARRMAAPIVALRRATARIAAGDLSTDLSSARHDEIEGLAGDFNQMVGQLRDLYASLEAKVAERTAELSLRKEEAERANAAKTRFLAAASHDLRQPMHSISLLMGVLRARLAEPAQLEIADKVQSSVATMEALFGNLLDISKLDAGAVHPHIEDVDLGWLLERAAQTWAPQAQEKGLQLRVRPGHWIVKADSALLERIVGNLLSNAIRYTRSGGVLVGCRRRGERCELQVWDTGPGIEPEHQQAIFEEFFRIGAPGTGQEKGLGLGLSIVRRCALILGYTLALHSRLGRGSVFTVGMPLSQASLTRPVPAGAAQASHALAGKFIVVVDDEPTNREAVAEALLAAGCHVVAAASGIDAVAQLESHLRAPDLILTDYQLGPGANGLQVIRELREQYLEAIPALLVTANTDAALLSEAAALGAAILHKPVGLPRLIAAIQAALQP